jgi:outer membrane protein insertion porin family
MRAFAVALTFIIASACAFTASAARAADLSRLPVRSILFKDDRGIPWPDPQNLLPLIEIKQGDPFSRDSVRQGIKYLYLKGQFRDIRVEAFPEPDGLRLEYTLVPKIIVEQVVFRGNHSLPDRSLREALRGIEGRELREELFPDIRTDMQTRYQAEGFYNAKVNFRIEPSEQPHRVIVFVYITEQTRTVIESVRFTGTTVLGDRDLLPVMQNRPGRPLLTNLLFEKDLDAVRKEYAAAGYPAAVPGPVSMSFRNERAVLEIAVAEGPKVTASFSGTDAFCTEHFPDLSDPGPDGGRPASVRWTDCTAYFRGLLLIWTEHDVSEAVIESSAETIRNVYRDAGYPDVKVEVNKTEAPGSLDLVFAVHEGLKVTVDSIRVEGNTVFTAEKIRDMMETRPSGWLRSRPYRDDVLQNDVDVITEQYNAAGYLSADVKRTVTRSADGRRAAIVLKVSEGRQTLTGDITFEGNSALGSDELARAIHLKPAAPFSERLLEEDRYRILSLYSAKGYLYARVDAERNPVFPEAAAGREGKGGQDSVLPEVVGIRFRITEDRQVVIGKVILRGNIATRDNVILREVEPRTGEPYNYEAILKSQQRIYRHGYFSLAKFEPVRPLEKEYVKDMLFTVEERDAGAVEFGVGYGTLDRLRGFVEVSHRNLFGSAHSASLRLEASDILERAAFTYRETWFLGVRDLDGKFILAWSNAKEINEQTREVYFQTRKTSVSYGAEKTAGRFKVSLTYQYENVDNYNVQQEAMLTPEDTGWVRISSLNPGIILDTRDDLFNPKSGGIHGINVKEAFSLFGAKAEFTKVTVQSTWFLGVSKSTIIALSGRAGRGVPHHDTAEVPIHERFYLGGGTTVRGYIQDSIGPPTVAATSDKVPTGGDHMVQLNAEARLNADGAAGLVLFTDAGNVWNKERIQLDDLRASYGVGLRYSTPVGPLRIDYGQKIHRRPGESPGELHFNIGQAF